MKTITASTEINFFSDATLKEPVAFSGSLEEASDEILKITAENLLKLLVHGWQPHAEKIYDNKVLVHALDVERSPRFLKIVREKWQESLENFSVRRLCKTQPDFEAQDETLQFFLHNFLALLPFLDPYPDEIFRVPQYIEKQWQLVNYRNAPIELTPREGLIASMLTDQDRVFSYGLTPLDDAMQTNAYLIHSGTTYPTGQGIWVQNFTNLFPGVSVGQLLHQAGYEAIHAWIQQQWQPIHVVGVSLGGSLSLYTAAHFGDAISQVYAFNPAGLLHHSMQPSKPKIHVISQQGDIVSRGFGGYWPDNAAYVAVMPKDPDAFVKQEKTFLQAYQSLADLKTYFRILAIQCLMPHIAIFTGFQGGVALVHTTGAAENQRVSRAVSTLLFYRFTRLIVFAPSVFTTLLFALLVQKYHQLSLAMQCGMLSENTCAMMNTIVPAASFSYLLFHGIPKTVANKQTATRHDILVKLFLQAALLMTVFSVREQFSVNTIVFMLYIPALTRFATLVTCDTPCFLSALPARFRFVQTKPAGIHAVEHVMQPA